MVKKRKYEHNIILSEDKGNSIIIRGNELNCRWFGECILVWSDKDNPKPFSKEALQFIDKLRGKDNE